jgi:hypothetical protein
MKNGFIGFRIDSYQTECVSTVTRKRGEYTRGIRYEARERASIHRGNSRNF